MKNQILHSLIAACAVTACTGDNEIRTVGQYQSVRVVGDVEMSLVAETELPNDATEIRCPGLATSDDIETHVEDGTLVIIADGDADDCSASVVGDGLVRIELTGDEASAGALDITSDGEFHVESLSADSVDLSVGGDAVLLIDRIDVHDTTASLGGQAFLSVGSFVGDGLDVHMRGGSEAVLGGVDLALLTVDASGNSSLRAQGAVDQAEVAIGGNATVDLSCAVLGSLSVDLHGGPLALGGDTEIDHGMAGDCDPFDHEDLHDGEHDD